MKTQSEKPEGFFDCVLCYDCTECLAEWLPTDADLP